MPIQRPHLRTARDPSDRRAHAGRHAAEQFARRGIARGDRPGLGAVVGVETEIGLAGVRVGAVAAEAVFGEDRSHVPVVADLVAVRGRRERPREKAPEQEQEAAAQVEVMSFLITAKTVVTR